MTKSQELLNKIMSLYAAAKAIVDKGENEKYDSTMKEITDLRAEYEKAKMAEETEKFLAAEQIKETKPVSEKAKEETKEDTKETKKVDSVKAFAAAARAGFPKAAGDIANETTGSDGGYTVPEDIVTRIYRLKEAKDSLLKYVDVENVKTKSGARTYKTRAQQTGFSLVGIAEGGDIPLKKTPQYGRITYSIKKYGGIFPVTNEVLEDTDENLVNIITEWIADESRVTANKLILKVIDTKWSTKTDLKNLDGIKKALNVTLGQAFKPSSKIFTNDDGLQYLDTLKDLNGRYLLNPDPSDPAKLRLGVGALTVPVVVIPNADMPSDTENERIPFIIGDMKEAIKFFDRKQLSIMTTNTATVGDLNAFEEDLTLFRALEREDVVNKDLAALVNGYISVGQ